MNDCSISWGNYKRHGQIWPGQTARSFCSQLSTSRQQPAAPANATVLTYSIITWWFPEIRVPANHPFPPTPAKQGGERQGIRCLTLVFKRFAVSEASQRQTPCALGAGRLQDGVNSWNKLKKFVLQKTLQFLAVLLARFGNKIRWCFAVRQVPQRHIACAWQASRLLDMAKRFEQGE